MDDMYSRQGGPFRRQRRSITTAPDMWPSPLDLDALSGAAPRFAGISQDGAAWKAGGSSIQK